MTSEVRLQTPAEGNFKYEAENSFNMSRILQTSFLALQSKPSKNGFQDFSVQNSKMY